jgi:hypothetical protein
LWQPGESGNPQGVSHDTKKIRELARTYSVEAIEKLASLMRSARPADQIKAAAELLDRAHGKPSSEVSVSVVGDPLGIAQARAAAFELLGDPVARDALRAAVRGRQVPSLMPAVIDATSQSSSQSSSSSVLPSSGEHMVTAHMVTDVKETIHPVLHVEQPPPEGDLAAWFRDIVRRYPRVAICGGPKTGKTTLSAYDLTETIHTDDYIGSCRWEDVPERVIRDAGDRPIIVEGVQAARALRSGLAVNAAIWLDVPRVPRSRKQEIMAAGVRIIFCEWQQAHNSTPVFTPMEGGAYVPFSRPAARAAPSVDHQKNKTGVSDE